MLELKDKFRESMSRLASGVTIVLTEIDGRPWGVTVSACCSLSMEPPLILVSLANKSVSTKAIINNKRFDVSVLSADQVEVAQSGAKAGEPKFFEDFVTINSDFGYNVKNALTSINCKLYKSIPVGDHTIFIGLVENVSLGNLKSPLLYFNRRFGEFSTCTKPLSCSCSSCTKNH